MKCEKCGSEMKLQEFVYISDPVRYGYKCPKCGNVQYSMIREENNQMDYEKAYKDALEKIIDGLQPLPDGTKISGVTRAFLEEVFPERKESEDEKIRKGIIELVKQSSEILNKKNQERMLAWLEKQGESSDQIHYWTEEEIKPIINDYLRGVEHYGGMIGRLRCLKPKSIEKQGNCSIKWQKNTPDNKPAIYHSVLMKTTQGIAEGEWQGEHWFQYRWSWTLKDSEVLYWMNLYELEKQGEQKTADKVEPKFHKGEWIVWKNKCYKVNYNGCGYELIDQNGLSTSLEYGTVDENAHLWDITKDAKDGDVVVDKSDGTIGIFQSIGHHPNGGSFNDPSYCFLHCHYDDGFFYADFEDGNIMDSYDAIPATKEQRDLLFQEMEEAGYEWDAEKKELKKIHVIDDGKAEMDYCFTKMMAGKKASPTWSEEDDYNLQCMIAKVTSDIQKGNVGRNNELIDWLKSLKDRVQPKQEWSEDDEKMCQETIDWFEKKCFPYALESENPARESIKWLKSLKGRITWKPSKEQMHAFVQVYEWYNDNFAPSETLTSLYNDLKKL